MYDDRCDFCVCSFIDSIYLIGGFLREETDTCLEFKTIDKSWKTISKMNQLRSDASCVVFEGRIVVSGGWSNVNFNTVEAYDPLADTWSPMPSMIERRYRHTSTAMRNKLFIVGG